MLNNPMRRNTASPIVALPNTPYGLAVRQELATGQPVGALEGGSMMNTILRFDFIWIPGSLGGHSAEPYEGMRTTIRWQKYLTEFLQCARDVQWETIDFDPEISRGQATCRLTSDEPLPNDWLKDGELIELLSGFRVLAIGRIIKQASLGDWL